MRFAANNWRRELAAYDSESCAFDVFLPRAIILFALDASFLPQLKNYKDISVTSVSWVSRGVENNDSLFSAATVVSHTRDLMNVINKISVSPSSSLAETLFAEDNEA